VHADYCAVRDRKGTRDECAERGEHGLGETPEVAGDSSGKPDDRNDCGANASHNCRTELASGLDHHLHGGPQGNRQPSPCCLHRADRRTNESTQNHGSASPHATSSDKQGSDSAANSDRQPSGYSRNRVDGSSGRLSKHTDRGAASNRDSAHSPIRCCYERA
jgi:hypothetical protein